MRKADVRPDALLQASNGAVISTVAGNPKAIGYVGFGYLNSSVKGINVNGVDPTIENGKSRKYPISRGLYMYVNKNSVSREARSFIDFILGAEGQKIVTGAGFISL
jgi:phosphate transport system substrate-binding protein